MVLHLQVVCWIFHVVIATSMRLQSGARVKHNDLVASVAQTKNATADGFKCCKVTESRLWPTQYKYIWPQSGISYNLLEFHCKQGRSGLDWFSMTTCRVKGYEENKYPSFAKTVFKIDEVETVDPSQCATAAFCKEGDSFKPLVQQEVKKYRDDLFIKEESYPEEWKDLWKLLYDLKREKTSRSNLANKESGAWEDAKYDSVDKRMQFTSEELSAKLGHHDRKVMAEKIVSMNPSSTVQDLMNRLDAKKLTDMLSQLEKQKREADMREEMLESPLVPSKKKSDLEIKKNQSLETELEFLYDIWGKFEVVKAISGLEAEDSRPGIDFENPMLGSWKYSRGWRDFGLFHIRRSEGGEGLKVVEDDVEADLVSPSGIAGVWVYDTSSVYQVIQQADDVDSIKFIQGRMSGVLTWSADTQTYEGDISIGQAFVGHMSLKSMSDVYMSLTFDIGKDRQEKKTAYRFPFKAAIPDLGSLYYKQSYIYRSSDYQPLIMKFIAETYGGVPSISEAFRSGRVLSDPPQDKELDALWTVILDGSDSLSTLKYFCRRIANELGKEQPKICQIPAKKQAKKNGAQHNRNGGFGMNMRTGVAMGWF